MKNSLWSNLNLNLKNMWWRIIRKPCKIMVTSCYNTLLHNYCIKGMLCWWWICFVEHPKELTEEEKQQIVHSEDFLIFFDRSIRLVERTLAEDLDIFFDYSGRDMEDREGSEHFSPNKKFHQCIVYMRQIHSFANFHLPMLKKHMVQCIQIIISIVLILTGGLLILKGGKKQTVI